MVQRYQHKRSEIPGSEPLANDIGVGEIAVNLEDGLLFSKKADNTIVPVGGATGGGDGPTFTTSDTAPVSPAVNDRWFNSDTLREKIYYDDGVTEQWVDVLPIQAYPTGFDTIHIVTVADQDYYLSAAMPEEVNWQSMNAKCVSGSCTVDLYINDALIPGTTINVDQTDQSVPVNQVAAVGQSVFIRVSNNSDATDLTINLVRG